MSNTPETIEGKQKLIRQYQAVIVFCVFTLVITGTFISAVISGQNTPVVGHLFQDKSSVDRFTLGFVAFMPFSFAAMYLKQDIEIIRRLRVEIEKLAGKFHHKLTVEEAIEKKKEIHDAILIVCFSIISFFVMILISWLVIFDLESIKIPSEYKNTLFQVIVTLVCLATMIGSTVWIFQEVKFVKNTRKEIKTVS